MYHWTSIRMYSIFLSAVLCISPRQLKACLSQYREGGYTSANCCFLAVFEDGRWINIEDGTFDSNDIDWAGWVD